MMAFHWSGANSVQERDASAHQLAASLDANAFPRLSQVIIGHSHGGTIALTAAEHYRKKPGEVLVVTLATPFIDMFPRIDRKDPDHDKQVTRYHNLQLGKTRLMGFLAGLLSYFAIKTVMPGAWTGSFSISYLVIGLLSTVYAIIFNNIYGKHADSLNEVPPPYGSTCNANAVRLLVVRGTEDEAALALAAGAIQSLLASSVVSLIADTANLTRISGSYLVPTLPSWYARATAGWWTDRAMVCKCEAVRKQRNERKESRRKPNHFVQFVYFVSRTPRKRTLSYLRMAR
jgi:hypothetical protein